MCIIIGGKLNKTLVRLVFSVLFVMVLGHGGSDVHSGKQRKHVGLNGSDQYLYDIDKDNQNGATDATATELKMKAGQSG